ncbi:uncharacterized protein BYT42DRAFT_574222 [Radiomyces spectabilis]|uniref:uncharacterized protein n=1 Tax=Radiomyces spectabilis TaxID=64574 RepID=UPI00221EFA86|nr:uncharacterized protein BYT42DRAFT_574222 [Radiomyces spectabilis]KAI8376324.1 hypothetical protein BYT42DRAFT_574222 [Radiomyces spectabilis]
MATMIGKIVEAGTAQRLDRLGRGTRHRRWIHWGWSSVTIVGVERTARVRLGYDRWERKVRKRRCR